MRDSLQRGGRGREIPSREEEEDEQLADFLANNKAVTCKLAPSMIKVYLSGLSNTFLRQNDEQYSDDGDGDASEPELKDFLAKHKRADAKEVKCKLANAMINHYFDSIVGEGTFNKDAREELEDKHWLDQKQYKRMAPPDLSQTKLHMVDNLDFSGLSNTLILVHRGARRAAKLQ